MPPSQYAARQPSQEETEKPVTVLVTGFGPFLTKYPRNSSWEIASSLPALIPASASNKTPIHIHVHSSAIRVSYSTVRTLIPALLPPSSPLTPAPEIILHIGLAASRSYFAIEQGAQSRGYGRIPDVDGGLFSDAEAEKAFPESKFPGKLTTSFDTADVLARWKANLGYTSVDGTRRDEGCADVRISPDAGNYLCGFIYWNSLAHYFSIKEDIRPVVFMHVPDLTGSEDKMREGLDVAVALIKALVESRRKVGVVGTRQDKAASGGIQTDNNFA